MAISPAEEKKRKKAAEKEEKEQEKAAKAEEKVEKGKKSAREAQIKKDVKKMTLPEAEERVKKAKAKVEETEKALENSEKKAKEIESKLKELQTKASRSPQDEANLKNLQNEAQIAFAKEKSDRDAVKQAKEELEDAEKVLDGVKNGNVDPKKKKEIGDVKDYTQVLWDVFDRACGECTKGGGFIPFGLKWGGKLLSGVGNALGAAGGFVAEKLAGAVGLTSKFESTLDSTIPKPTPNNGPKRDLSDSTPSPQDRERVKKLMKDNINMLPPQYQFAARLALALVPSWIQNMLIDKALKENAKQGGPSIDEMEKMSNANKMGFGGS